MPKLTISFIRLLYNLAKVKKRNKKVICYSSGVMSDEKYLELKEKLKQLNINL